MTDNEAPRALAVQNQVEAEVAGLRGQMKEFRHEYQLVFKRRPKSPVGEEFSRIPPRTPFELEREAELQELGRMFRALLSEQQSAFRRIEYVHQESAKENIKKAKVRVLKITLMAGACISVLLGAFLAAGVGYVVYGKSPVALAGDVIKVFQGQGNAVALVPQTKLPPADATTVQHTDESDPVIAAAEVAPDGRHGELGHHSVIGSAADGSTPAGVATVQESTLAAPSFTNQTTSESQSSIGNEALRAPTPKTSAQGSPLPTGMPTSEGSTAPGKQQPTDNSKKGATAAVAQATQGVSKSGVNASKQTGAVPPKAADAPSETIFAISPGTKGASAGIREPAAAAGPGAAPLAAQEKSGGGNSAAAGSAPPVTATKPSAEQSKPVRAKFGDSGVTTLLPEAVVVIDPVKKTQSMVRVGQKLPDGTVIKSVDPLSGLVKTDRGDVIFD